MCLIAAALIFYGEKTCTATWELAYGSSFEIGNFPSQQHIC